MIKQINLRVRSLWISIPAFLVLLCLVAMFFLNHEPPAFNPMAAATLHAQKHHHEVVTGYTTTSTLIETVDVMLNKRELGIWRSDSGSGSGQGDEKRFQPLTDPVNRGSRPV
jgi:hypothetical protein